MKISLERLLAGSSRLQDHRQRNCVIRSVIIGCIVVIKSYISKNPHNCAEVSAACMAE